MQKSSTPYSSVFLSCYMRSCIRMSTPSLLSKRMFVCSVRAAFENVIFAIGVSVCGERLTEDDTVVSIVIACDCSFT